MVILPPNDQLEREETALSEYEYFVDLLLGGPIFMESLPWQETLNILTLLLLTVLIATVLYGSWRRCSERRTKTTLHDGRILLPTPRSLLPSWFGYLSGHTLSLHVEKVC